MTTYFTPVGALSELTLARGSQINDREDAVESGFAALEASIGPTDGAASISYGGTWSVDSSKIRLQKINGLVALYAQVTGSGGQVVGPTLFTLPSGYRPAVAHTNILGHFYSAATATSYESRFTIATSGAVSVPLAISSAAAGDVFTISTTFLNA